MDSVANLLVANMGRVVTLSFDDGEVVDAKILHVDLDDHRDITIDVVAVRRAIPTTHYDPNVVYVMPIAAIINLQEIGD